jgi:replicative DNA helicase
MTHEVIKKVLKEPRLFKQIPMEALDELEGRILYKINEQAQLIDQPTLKSVINGLGLNAAETEAILPLVKSISTAPNLDNAEFELAMFKLRTKAQMNLIRLANTIMQGEHKPKDLDAIMERIHLLRTQKEDQYRQPINAKQWEKLQMSEEEEIKINIDWFDDNDVPIKKKVLYGFIATTNGGKTIIKTWFATKLIRAGQNIVYLALEEPSEDTIRRVWQSCLSVTESQFKVLTQNSFEELGEKFKKKANEMNWGEFIVVEWPNIQVQDMKLRLTQYQKENNISIDGIVVDYGKLINIGHKSQAEWERIGLVFKELKTFCMEMNMYCITSIQLNRESTRALLRDGQTADLYDVAGAYEATHHLNYIWAVQLTPNIEDNLDYDNPNTVLGQFKLTVQKSKYGKLPKGSSMSFSWTADHNLVQLRQQEVNDVQFPDI